MYRGLIHLCCDPCVNNNKIYFSADMQSGGLGRGLMGNSFRTHTIKIKLLGELYFIIDL